MDLKHSDTLDSVGDAYIPNSKSSDLIKPSKSGNLDNQQTSGEADFFTYPTALSRKVSQIFAKAFKGNEKKSFVSVLRINNHESVR